MDFIADSYPASPLLKGLFNSKEKAINLLKDNDYDVKLSLKKILFPMMTIVNRNTHSFKRADSTMLGYFKDKENPSSPVKISTSTMLNTSTTSNFISKVSNISNTNQDLDSYLNSALHDLIGSTIKEKQEWNEVVSYRLTQGIDYSELLHFLEIAEKLKIDVPKFVIDEIEKSFEESKVIKKVLSDKTSIENLEFYYEKCMSFKIRTTEFYSLKDALLKSVKWKEKAYLVMNHNQSQTFKTIQNIFNEGKNLPVLFPEFDSIKFIYNNAQNWQEKYNQIPKHSKTRNSLTGKIERTSLKELKSLIKEASSINFTSQEVSFLEQNYNSLSLIENKIRMTLEDFDVLTLSTNPFFERISKEVLQDFLNQLDNLKYNTYLYDDLLLEIEFIDWNERKNSYVSCQFSKSLKMKQLRNLVGEAKKKKIFQVPFYNKYVNSFIENVNMIDTWIVQVSSVFYKDIYDSTTKDEYSIEEINDLSKKVKTFLYIPEEVEILIEKIKEVNEFIEECSFALNNQHFNQDKLESLKEKISKYRLKCPEFKRVTSHMNDINSWINLFNSYISQGQRKLSKELTLTKMASFEMRRNYLNQLEGFEEIQGLYSNDLLLSIIESNPNLNKYIEEDSLLNKLSQSSVQFENNSKILVEDTVSVVVLNEILLESRRFCVSNCFVKMIISKIKYLTLLELIESLQLIDYENNGNDYEKNENLTLSNAEILLKELVSYSNINSNINNSSMSMTQTEGNPVNFLKNKINFTKEWLKFQKKICSSIKIDNKITYNELYNLLSEGLKSTFLTDELKELISYYNSLNNLCETAKKMCNLKEEKIDYNDLNIFINEICYVPIEVPEFEILINLFKVGTEWKEQIIKILSTRKPCILYFLIDDCDLSSVISQELIENCYEKEKIECNSLSNSNISHANRVLNKKRELQSLDFQSSTSNLPKKPKSKKELLEDSSISLIEIKKKSNSNWNYRQNQKTDENIYFASCFDNLKIKHFLHLNYLQRLAVLSTKAQLRLKSTDEFCICRRGDDGINFMIGCEMCKEWFHGACINLTKSLANKKDFQFICSICRKRYDKQTSNIDIFNTKRVSLDELDEFTKEASNYPLYFKELDEIIECMNKYSDWRRKYSLLLSKYMNFHIKPFVESSDLSFFLDNDYEKSFISLYNESEMLPMVIPSSIFSVIILKHYDWFNEARKCYENKKVMEKNSRKVFNNYERLFNWNIELCKLDVFEKNYLEDISKKASFVNKKLENKYYIQMNLSSLCKIPRYQYQIKEFDQIYESYSINNEFSFEEIEKYIIFKKNIIDELENIHKNPLNYLNSSVNDAFLRENQENLVIDMKTESISISKEHFLYIKSKYDESSENIRLNQNNLWVIIQKIKKYPFQTQFLDRIYSILTSFDVFKVGEYLELIDEKNKK